jgi:hypothetical protein
MSPQQVEDRLLGRGGVSALARWITPASLASDRGLDRLAKDRIPGLKELVGDQSVAVFPDELSVCVANALECVPQLTLQAYSTYTAELDERAARKLGSPEGPRFVLFDWHTIDYRHEALDTPLLWRTLLRNYRAIGNAGRFVLMRRGEGTTASEVTFAESEARFDVPIPVPEPTSGRTHVRMELSLTPWGSLMQTVFRIPPVFLAVLHASGRESEYRVVPDTLRNGVPIEEFAEPDALDPLLVGQPASDRVVALILSGPGLRYFREPIRLTWVRE